MKDSVILLNWNPAYSSDEAHMIESDDRIIAWRAREIQEDEQAVLSILDCLMNISGPIWLSIDVDALDSSIVTRNWNTGTRRA